jgi:thiol-disulfide isomerase/thioredoxin
MKKIAFILLAIFFTSAFSGCLDSGGNNNGDGTGDNFTFVTIDNEQKQLSDYRGRIVILDMMATWCQPCQYQMFELKRAYENYSRNELEIISIDIDVRETAQQLRSYREAFKQQLGIELDWIFGMGDGSIWEKYKYIPPGRDGPGVPTLYIFDREGKVYFRHVGISVFSEIPPGWPQDTPKLKPVIDELLD